MFDDTEPEIGIFKAVGIFFAYYGFSVVYFNC